MKLSKSNVKIDQHWLLIIASVVFSMLLIGIYLLLIVWPASSLQQDLIAEKLELEEQRDSLQTRIDHLQMRKDDDDAVRQLEADRLLHEQWAVETWDMHFTQLLHDIEREYAVLFTDISYQDSVSSETSSPVTSNVTISQFEVSLVMGGTLQQMGHVLDHLYDMPNTFILSSWDLSPGAVLSSLDAEDEPYTLRLQGYVQLVKK